MSFDIRTAILGLAVGNLVCGAILYFYQSETKYQQNFPFFTAGKFMQGLGWLLLYGRGVLPDFLSFTIGNILLIVGTAYESWALVRIMRRQVSHRVLTYSTIGVVVICIFATFLSAASRVAVASFTVMIFFAIGGYSMLKGSGGNPLLRHHIGGSMLLMVVVTCIRGLWATIAPEHFTLFASNTIQLIMFAGLYYLMLTNSFGVLLFVKGITDRELYASEERFRSYFELPLIGICITSPQKSWLAVNQKLCDMLGYTKDELMAMTWADLTHPDDLALDVGHFTRVLSGETDGYELEKRFFCKDGLVIFTKVAVQCVRNPDQSVNYIVAIIEDITAQKETLEALHASEEKYRVVFETMPTGVLVTDPTGKIIENNRAAQLILAISSDEDALSGLDGNDWSYIRPDGLTIPDAEFASTRAMEEKKAIYQVEEGIRNKISGKFLWINVSAAPLPGVGTVITFEDITAKKQAETAEKQQHILAEALRDSASALNSTLNYEEVLDRILENADRVVPYEMVQLALIDPDGINAQIVRYHDFQNRCSPEEIQDKLFTISCTRNLSEVLNTGKPEIITDTGSYHGWVQTPYNGWIGSCVTVPIKIKGKITGFLTLMSAKHNHFSPIDAENLQSFADQASIAIENARLFGQVNEFATTDSLTGLFNRRSLFQFGQREVERALRFERPLAAIMLDLDHFKWVNDSFGHLNGDRVMVALANCCRAQLRQVDIIARYGGDEFVIILPETDLKNAACIAERIRAAVQDLSIPVEEKANQDPDNSSPLIRITTSLGVSQLMGDTSDLSALISAADQALYTAKNCGRNQVAMGHGNGCSDILAL